ncbi:steroid receptor RNA activator 1 [Plodia interpunctella]|uniref:steroid receptor RNA activator 1 n=1 Tax=Plodia interpunctella TaxID=58824 RepID=UPI002368C8E1|nr:steroid receptor RNA activator 1 [Plodia interpunctella]
MENCNHSPNQPGKVPYDPGWNDPPKFSYNTQQATPNRPRNFLNKRVAFPLSGGGAVSTAQSPMSSPAIPSALPSTPPVKLPPRTEPQETVDIDSEHALCEVKDILLSLLDNSSELGQKATDIKRRIVVMEDMWINEKLNKSVQFQMRELAYALKNEEPQKADEIHRALMVDHVSAVGTWMPGVKQLIHHYIARNELLAIDKESSLN